MSFSTTERERRQDLGGYRVLPENDGKGEMTYAVVTPTGVPLYTFADIRDANAEAAQLNGPILRAAARSR